MKGWGFLKGLLGIFLIEAAMLALFFLPNQAPLQDTVAVNEVLHTLQADWGALEEHQNGTALQYAVIDREGNLLYRTRLGLSETVNAAVRHKDTILDVEIQGTPVGKLLIYNEDAAAFQTQRQQLLFGLLAAMALQLLLCGSFLFYIQRTVITPFQKLKGLAQRIAEGNLDIPLEMDRKNLFGAFTESFDILRSELKKARIAEAKANESKKELVAKLSHDIKTPVASIRAASEVGAALAADEKNRSNYQGIIRKADQINTLVTNLFSAALEELQELSVSPAELKSREIRTLLENADYLHRAAIPAVPDCVVLADKLRLQQVFDNLFANSYKYAGTEIHVSVEMEACFLNVYIEDSGGGVSPGELPLLKEKFKRGSNAGAIEGAGLGLYIADSCMKKMGGQLRIENAGAGLRATVRIALAKEFPTISDLRDI